MSKFNKNQTNKKEAAPSFDLDELLDLPVKKVEKKKKLSKRTIWIIGGAILIILVIILVSTANAKKSAASLSYQTGVLEKGELVAVVGATGTVRANQTAILTWQTTGRIEKINFEIGDQVAAGEVIANLAQSSLPQSVILAGSDLYNAQLALDKLKESDAARSNSALALANAQRKYNNALANYWDRNDARGTDDLINVTQAKLTQAEKRVKDLQEIYNKVASASENNIQRAIALQSLSQARIDRDAIQKQLDYYVGNPDSISVETLQAELDLAKANLKDAQIEFERLKNGFDPKEVAAAEAKVTAIQATVDLATLKSPFAGTLTEVNSMAGDMVTGGTATFRIDDFSKLMVDIDVPEVDINNIKIGQDASLTFDAIPEKEYSAIVTEVARVGETIGGVVEFKVTLQILNPDSLVLPGMTAAVNITIDKKENVLLAPNRAIRLVNGQYVIYIVRDNTEKMVPIEIGSTSDINSEIVSGDVTQGDVVILNPSSSLIDIMQNQSQSRSPASGMGR